MVGPRVCDKVRERQSNKKKKCLASKQTLEESEKIQFLMNWIILSPSVSFADEDSWSEMRSGTENQIKFSALRILV